LLITPAHTPLHTSKDKLDLFPFSSQTHNKQQAAISSSLLRSNNRNFALQGHQRIDPPISFSGWCQT
jgi:hypothetical protein